jgi:hypothetical protein
MLEQKPKEFDRKQEGQAEGAATQADATRAVRCSQI